MTLSEKTVSILEISANSIRAQGMQDYMKGNFVFYGVPSPVRKDICKEVYALSRKIEHDDLIKDIHFLWKQDARECQYAGLDILIKNKKRLTGGDIEDVQYWITHKSWWDTVDGLASHIVGSLFAGDKNRKTQYLEKWLASPDIWLNRVCLIFQLKYQEETDFDRLTSYILKLKHKDEFFIQKAIGWSLRQYSKFDPRAVSEFVNSNSLSNLARREAIRLIK